MRECISSYYLYIYFNRARKYILVHISAAPFYVFHHTLYWTIKLLFLENNYDLEFRFFIFLEKINCLSSSIDMISIAIKYHNIK